MGYVAEKARELAFGGMQGLLKNLWDESKPGLDRSGVNRFRYDAGNVRLFGRDDELAFLWEFCDADVHFSWFAISGEGGSGKTRLAHTFGQIINYVPGWMYDPKHHKVDYARPEGLTDAKQALKDASQNTLLVLDYVKWHTDSIGKWLYDLWCEWHDRNLKIRVLLVERDAISPRDLRWQHDVMAAQYRPVADAPFLDDNNLMRLQPLDDDDMISVVNDYAVAFDAQVDASLIIETLKKIDPQLRRPLYALFLTDALVMGEDLQAWDQSAAPAALEYIYGKERARIQDNVDFITGDKQNAEDLTDIAFRALLTATLSGGMEWGKYVQLHSEDADVLQSLSSRAEPTGQRLLAKCLGTPYEKGEALRIPPLEPDLMGEYFCIQELLPLKNKQRQEVIGLAMLNDQRRAAVVFDRIAHDYAQLLVDMEMTELFTNIAIPEGLDEVWSYAFYECDSIVKVTFPKSMQYIGEQAFGGCCNLSQISFNHVKQIGVLAFSGCTALSDIAMPDSLVKIDGMAFDKCHSIKNVTIPQNVRIIEGSIFDDCENLLNIHVHPENKNYVDLEGVLFTIDKTKLMMYPSGRKGKYIVPKCVKSIGVGAFSGCRLEDISLPPMITKIDECTFSHSTSLISISIPNTVVSIGEFAFYDCTSLSTIHLAEGLKVIEDDAFVGCINLERLFVPSSVEEIGMGAFEQCRKLLSISISGDSHTSLSDDVFKDCPSLRDVYIRGKDIQDVQGSLYYFQGLKEAAFHILPAHIRNYVFRKRPKGSSIYDYLSSSQGKSFT